MRIGAALTHQMPPERQREELCKTCLIDRGLNAPKSYVLSPSAIKRDKAVLSIKGSPSDQSALTAVWASEPLFSVIV